MRSLTDLTGGVWRTGWTTRPGGSATNCCGEVARAVDTEPAAKTQRTHRDALVAAAPPTGSPDWLVASRYENVAARRVGARYQQAAAGCAAPRAR